MATTLVLGGARSGKSRFAQERAEALHARDAGGRLVMIATAQALDDEMRDRIARHRADRDGRWTTIEAARDLAEVIRGLAEDDVAVIDCLTLWLSDAMGRDADIPAVCADLTRAVADCPANLIIVSNEVGWGIVPENALARAFRDHAGRLHQDMARVAGEAFLILAGLAIPMKG